MLFCALANGCHERNEIRNGAKKKDEAPFLPLFPPIGVRPGMHLQKDGGRLMQ